MNEKKPILMEEGCWANSPYSIARLYGRIYTEYGKYMVVNKHGITILELTSPSSKHYVGYCRRGIEAGEPADLVLSTFIPTYKEVGRDAFINALKAGCRKKSEIVEFSKKSGSQ